MKLLEGNVVGTGLKVGIVAARFNEFIVSKLVSGAQDALVRHGVSADDIEIAWVPGAFEIPLIAQKMANSMVVQAEEEKKRMIAEAERAALQRKAEVEQEVADAEYQLKMAKNATAQFVEGMRELVKQESAFLDQLPAIKAEPIHPKKAEPAPAPVAPEAEAAKDEPAEAKSDDCIDQILQEEADAEQEPAAVAAGEAVAEMEETEGHRIDFSNLQFGKDYEIK